MGRSIAEKYLSAEIGGTHLDIIQLVSKTRSDFRVLGTNLLVTAPINKLVHEVGIKLDRKQSDRGAIVVTVSDNNKIPLFLEIDWHNRDRMAHIELERISVPPKYGFQIYDDHLEMKIEEECFTSQKKLPEDSLPKLYVEPNLIIQYLYNEITIDDLRKAAKHLEDKKRELAEKQQEVWELQNQINQMRQREKKLIEVLEYCVQEGKNLWWKNHYIKYAIQEGEKTLKENEKERK